MTISSVVRTAGPFLGSGVETNFPFTFKVFVEADLVVAQSDASLNETTLVLSSDYTATLNADQQVSPGGFITLLTPLPTGESVTITSDVAALQPLRLTNASGFFPQNIEDAFDRLTILLQQADLGRSIRVPDAGGTTALPSAAARANHVMAFDSLGAPIVIVGVDVGSAAALDLDLASSSVVTKGAGKIGFAQNLDYGAGTIGRHAKQFPTAKDEPYGAAGDGITTDTTALQDFLTACAGKTGWIPPGTYKTGALTVPANTTIYGFGATLDFSGAGNVAGITHAGGFQLAGATLIGPGNATYQDASRAVVGIGTNNAPAAPTYIDGAELLYCTLSEWGGYGVFEKYTNNSQVAHCTITGIGYAAIAGLSTNDMLVERNLIDDVSPGSVTPYNAYGIFIDRSDGTSETAEPRSYRGKIIFNSVKNIPLWEAIDTHGGVDFLIHGNTVSACKHGIRVTDSKISGVSALAPQRCTVTNNNITIPAGGEAITINGAYNGTSMVEYATDCRMAGNIVKGGGVSNDFDSGAIRVYGTDGLTGDFGTVRGATTVAVNMNFENKNFNFSGGQLIDVVDAVAGASLVHFHGDNQTGFIGGATFAYATGGTFAAVTIGVGRSGLDIDFGPCSFRGPDGTRLGCVFGTTTGVNSSQLFSQTGTATLPIVSGHANDTVVVGYPKRMPFAAIKILLQQQTPIAPGGKIAQIIVESVTATSFTMRAYPTDLTTFSASGDVTIDWVAST